MRGTTPRRRALGTKTVALAIIVAVAIGGLGAGAVVLTHPSQGWRTVRSNITVYGAPASLGRCQAIAASCQVSINEVPSLVVNLISYNGTYYYEYIGELIGGSSITVTSTNSAGETSVSTSSQGETTTTYTAWFTNSTLYCVTPEMNTAPITCPT